MDTQNNLMLINPIAAFIYGLWFIFSPESYWQLLGVPEDAMSPLASYATLIVGAGLMLSTYVFLWIRAIVTEEQVEAAMLRFAAGWLFYGIGTLLGLSLYPIEGANTTLGYIQGILFLVLAVVYFVLRSPTRNASDSE